MKKSYFFLLFLLLSVQTWGQEAYTLFLEEGKVWKYDYNSPNGTTYQKSLIVKGDTVIDGKAYMRISDVATGRCEHAMREDGGKVYSSWDGNEVLVYDFSLNTGDVFTTQSVNATVVAVKTVVVDGRSFRALDVRDNENDLQPNWWVEGVGSMNYLTNSIPLPGDYYTFQQCLLGERVLFSLSDFEHNVWPEKGTIDGVKSVRVETPVVNALFDLQGRRLNGKPSKGIYILNNRKIIAR